jgi:carbonic anhydrase
MCFECRTSQFNRRHFLSMAGLGAAALAVSPALSFAATAESTLSPDEALAKLKDGNSKFVADANACAAHLAERRSETAKGQAPWATILTCSDSRVTPELIFGGVNLGELFVVRNAGNVLETNGLGTIEYGAEHLHAPLIVVMGHKKCGAVVAACDAVTNGTAYEASVGKMIQPIISLALAQRGKAGDFVDNTVHANAVRGAARILEESAIVSHLVEAGKVKVVPAYYDLDTGHVDFLPMS